MCIYVCVTQVLGQKKNSLSECGKFCGAVACLSPIQRGQRYLFGYSNKMLNRPIFHFGIVCYFDASTIQFRCLIVVFYSFQMETKHRRLGMLFRVGGQQSNSIIQCTTYIYNKSSLAIINFIYRFQVILFIFFGFIVLVT